MKTLLLFGLMIAASVVRAETLTATIKEQTKMEVTRGKGSIILKPGSVVEVVSQEGDVLGVVYRSITGFIPAAKTDFKGEVPKMGTKAAEPETKPKPSAETKTAPAPKPEEAKPAVPENREDPTTNYGKMVKKARDNEAKHKENLVEPTDGTTASKK